MGNTSTRSWFGWLWSLQTAVAVVTIGILALGIERLAQDEPLRTALSNKQAAALIGCFPSVEIPTTSPVSVLPLLLGNGTGNVIALPDGDSVPAATTMSVVTTGPVQVQARDTLPDEGAEVSLAGQTLVPTRSSGTFELRLESGAALIRNGDARLLLKDAARFGAAEHASYLVDVPQSSNVKAIVKVAIKEKQAVIPPGTRIGSIAIGAGQSVVPTQPLTGAIWMPGAPPTLNPVRVSGQPGLADLAIEPEKAGLRTDKAGATLVACGFREYTDDAGNLVTTKWTRAGVSSVATNPSGTATLSLASDLLPARWAFRTRLGIAMATSDGKGVAVGGGIVFGRVYAACLATVLTGLLLGLVMFHRGQQVKASDNSPRWFAGLFIGPDNDPSLSLLQIIIWTTITVWGFFYVFFVAGSLLSLTPEMMQLLGIAGAGTVMARWIAVSSGGSTSQTTSKETTGKETAGSANDQARTAQPNDFWKMLSTNGNFDLLKLQLFAFTVVIAMYVVWRIADAAAFPALDSNTLLLLGVSQGVYVTSKLAGASALAKAQTIKANLDVSQAAAKDLQDAKKKLVDEQADLTQKVAAAGAAVPQALQDQLADVTSRLNKASGQLDANGTTATAMEMDYDRALAALGLKRV